MICLFRSFAEDTGLVQLETCVDGLTFFLLGLAKKVVLADQFGDWANLGFDAVANGHPVTTYAAWGAVLSYSLQIYVHFSGYSDMAFGLARMFGLTFPMNFNSPYKAVSIIDFWRRWHITLSQFLRDHLYIPRRKPPRRSAAIPQLARDYGSWRPVAWGRLDFSYLGSTAWRVSYHKPCLECRP